MGVEFFFVGNYGNQKKVAHHFSSTRRKILSTRHCISSTKIFLRKEGFEVKAILSEETLIIRWQQIDL